MPIPVTRRRQHLFAPNSQSGRIAGAGGRL